MMRKALTVLGLLLCTVSCTQKPDVMTEAFAQAEAIVAAIKQPVFPDKTFLITDYGAVEGDSTALYHENINNAILACHNAGGGKVVVPQGTFYTGPIICLRPDGSIEDDCVKMLEEVGEWMTINGEAVYGSKAWKTLGEGEIIDGKLKKQPGGKLGKHHAEFPFNAQDIRFTEGKNGSIYAFCMAVPEAGQTVRILSMGKTAGHLSEIKDVALLGYEGTLEWKQTDEALEITCPPQMPCQNSIVFRIN